MFSHTTSSRVNLAFIAKLKVIQIALCQAKTRNNERSSRHVHYTGILFQNFKSSGGWAGMSAIVNATETTAYPQVTWPILGPQRCMRKMVSLIPFHSLKILIDSWSPYTSTSFVDDIACFIFVSTDWPNFYSWSFFDRYSKEWQRVS